MRGRVSRSYDQVKVLDKVLQELLPNCRVCMLELIIPQCRVWYAEAIAQVQGVV